MAPHQAGKERKNNEEKQQTNVEDWQFLLKL